MNPSPSPRRDVISALRLLPILALALLPAFLSGGCAGGTIIDVGNPSLAIGFRVAGQSVPFEGIAHFYAADSNPGFYRPAPLDGSGGGVPDAPVIRVSNVWSNGNAIPIPKSRIYELDGDQAGSAAGHRIALPVLSANADDKDFQPVLEAIPGAGTLHPNRPFNIVFNSKDGLTGYVQGLALDANREWYVDTAGKRVDTVWVDLAEDASYAGSIDTAGLADPPLAVFAPGSPFAARVHGNRFSFGGLPRSLLPVRMVTARGAIYDLIRPLDASKGSVSYNQHPALVLGARSDSIALPDPVPRLETPAASPAGPLLFTDSVVVALSAQAGTTLYYTVDGSAPGPHSSKPYDRPLVLKASTTLKAVAYRKGFDHSLVATHSYILVPAAPEARPGSQAFRDSLAVVLTTTAKDGAIHYTTDGSAPGAASPRYSGPLWLKSTTVLKAVTSVPGLGLSAVTEERYILIPDTLSQD